MATSIQSIINSGISILNAPSAEEMAQQAEQERNRALLAEQQRMHQAQQRRDLEASIERQRDTFGW
jgi:hypothetical protein